MPGLVCALRSLIQRHAQYFPDALPDATVVPPPAACSPGYGRIIDSKTPYACSKCPAGQVSVVASLGAQQQQQSGKPSEIRLAAPYDAAAAAAVPADKPVLAVCQACPKGTVSNAIQTACGEWVLICIQGSGVCHTHGAITVAAAG